MALIRFLIELFREDRKKNELNGLYVDTYYPKTLGNRIKQRGTPMSRNKKLFQYTNVDRMKEICSDYDTGNKGYGYASFCKKFNVPHSILARVIYKHADFSICYYYHIARMTGISIDWLLGLTNDKFISEPTFEPTGFGGSEENE